MICHFMKGRVPPAAAATLIVGILALGIGVSSASAPFGTFLVSLAVCGAVVVLPSVPQLGGLIDLVVRRHWWQLLWLAIFLSGLVLRVRTTTAARDSAFDTAAAYRASFITLAGIGLLVVMAIKKVDILAAISRGFFVPLLIFNLTNVVSTLWSVNPGWTLYKSIEFTIDTMLIAVIVARMQSTGEYKRLFDWTWLLSGLLLLSVGVGVLMAPDRAISHNIGTLGFSVEGVFPVISRNGVGSIAAILTVVAVSRLATGNGNRRLFACLLIVATGVLIISQTRSALIPVFLAVPLVFVATKRWLSLIAVIVAVTGVLLLGGIRSTIESYVAREGRSQEQNATLSGRVYYWSYAWERLTERPLTGYGAYAGGRFLVGEAFDEDLASAHGAFPEILIGTSFWGAFPVFLLLVALWVSLGRASLARGDKYRKVTLESALTIEAFAVLIVLTIRAFFTVGLVWHPSLEFLLVVGYAEFLRRHRRALAVEGARNGRSMHAAARFGGPWPVPTGAARS